MLRADRIAPSSTAAIASFPEDGQSRGVDNYDPIIGDAHLAFLRGNRIGMHATVLYRRDCLTEVGGFDETLRRCEDYDLYLRIAQRYPISSHGAIVAEYRKHDHNMSADAASMLQTMLAVLTVMSCASLSARPSGQPCRMAGSLAGPLCR